ncbi:AAA family ATPase [Aestuariivirga litoralis]|uniref:AAA family ATPase n=1 Tax=Aestuariivirga litoralis TaxID=2650924 RepID=UPI0018C47DFE|nr:AAA family ATPase [Aestuariivirga litoralis]MBG1233956.1 AAA family ATPase [Aestuariivirga litoralis]
MSIAAEHTASDLLPVAIVPRINIGVFCEDPRTENAMASAAADRRMSRAHVEIHSGGILGAAAHYANETTPNLVIVESRGASAVIMDQLAQLAEVCSAGTKVVVIGHVNDIVLFRELMKNHVSDYLVAPLDSLRIIESVAALYNDPKAAPLGRVIAFVGAKGGVGSSTLAHNVAYATSNSFDLETILTDLDLSFGTAALNYNQDGGGSFYEALASPDRVDSILLERLMSRLGKKLNLLNGSGALDRDMSIESNAVETVLGVLRQAAPVIVLDVPNAWSPWVKHTLLNADEIVVTATPELPSLRNTKNILDLLKPARPNDRQPLLVLNQVGMPKRPEIPASEFAKALGLEPVASIPHDPQTFGLAQGNGQMILEVAPKSKSAELLGHLSERLVGSPKSAAKAGKKSGLSSVLSMLKKKEA